MLYTVLRPPGGRVRLLQVLATLLTCIMAERALAQQPVPSSGLPAPRLFSLSPCGGKAGSSLEVTFTGQDIEAPEGLLFSQPGIKAEPIQPATPPPPPPDPKKPMPKQKKNAPKLEATTFKVTIAPGTPVGIHDVRLVNKWGVSNPRAFVVGDQTEVLEKEPNNDVPQAQRVEINSTVNGVIAAPTDVDFYVFHGKKGQRVVVSCLASTIDSRLLAALELYDSRGSQLAFNRHYRNHDALVDCTLPADGDYYVRLYEFTHSQGSPEHFYRLTISTAPWIDAVQPVVVEPGKTTSLTVYGRNLPGGRPDPTAIEDGSVLEKANVPLHVSADPGALQRLAFSGYIPPKAAALDGFEFRARNASGVSNAFLLTYARAPVILDNEANDTAQTAQEITLPCEISGRVEKRHDRDWYAFTAKKGDLYSIEVFSDRLGSPTDMYFQLFKPDKQQLADLDDNNDVLSQVRFFTRNEDPPAYRFTAPADGRYQMMVSSHDADNHTGPRHFYHVRIAPERPDFRIIALAPDPSRPDGCCVHQGSSEAYAVLAWRSEGWNGPITLSVEGLPAGVTCAPQVIGQGLREAALVLTAAATAPAWTGEIKIKATANINGQTVVREARSASITWPVVPQQGIPPISRLDRNLVLAVRDKAPFSLAAKAEKMRVLQGTKTNLALKIDRLWPDFKAAVQVAAIEPQTHLPPGVTVNNNQPLNIAAGKNDATAVLDVKSNAAPGTYNVVVHGVAQMPYNKDPQAKQKPNINVVLPATPVSITVLPAQVAALSLGNANTAVKVGKEAEVVVKVNRLHDFTGEFKVQFILPANVKGVNAAEISIPAGKNEAKLILKASADAIPGNRPNLIVRAVAKLDGDITVTHETKLNVNVVK
ncbi:MAG TPA: PPC domain-containing protein [Gemmataceae bacterium]|nr:PPC domain-containing protein [Gemmataceae bacterium]